MCFSQNGEWFDTVLQQADFAGRSIFPALSMCGFFSVHVSPESWQFKPPDGSYKPWSATWGVMCRPPPLDSRPDAAGASSSSSTDLDRTDSHVKNVGIEHGKELSPSDLIPYAKAVTEKTLVTNLSASLEPITEEFRKVVGDRKLQELTWESLQEMFSGQQLDPQEWIRLWKSRTTLKCCESPKEKQAVEYWWEFASEVSAEKSENVRNLFAWCTNFATVPATPWKFQIWLTDKPTTEPPTVKTCSTDDDEDGTAHAGVPQPILFLPPYESKEVLVSKMSVTDWQKGVDAIMGKI